MKIKLGFYLVLLISILFTAHSCKHVNSVSIVIGEKACTTEKLMAKQLKKDLEQVSGKSVTTVQLVLTVQQLLVFQMPPPSDPA